MEKGDKDFMMSQMDMLENERNKYKKFSPETVVKDVVDLAVDFVSVFTVPFFRKSRVMRKR